MKRWDSEEKAILPGNFQFSDKANTLCLFLDQPFCSTIVFSETTNIIISSTFALFSGGGLTTKTSPPPPPQHDQQSEVGRTNRNILPDEVSREPGRSNTSETPPYIEPFAFVQFSSKQTQILHNKDILFGPNRIYCGQCLI